MWVNWRNARLLLNADTDGGSGSGGGDRVEESFQRALDRRNNDGVALARELFDDNYRERSRNRELAQQLEALRAQVPGDGAVVLSAEDAAAWQAYRQFGDAATVQAAMAQRDQLQGELTQLRRNETLRTVAGAVGYKPTVLAELDAIARAKGKDLAFEVREVTQDGRAVAVPYVKDGDTELPLTDYAAQQWADFLPALSAAGTAAQASSGTRFPAQGTGHATAGQSDPVAAHIARQTERAQSAPNPLRKQ